MWHYSENLTVRATHPGLPWELNPNPPADNVCLDKDLRQDWYHNPGTKHVFYSSYEGVNSNVRISDENVAHVAHGFVVDIDHPHSEDRMVHYVNELPIKPSWMELSLGKKWRLIFLILDGSFILMKDKEVQKEFLSRLGDELGISRIPGLDEGSWFNPNRLYCRGGSPMIKISDHPTLTSGFLSGLQMEAVKELVRQAGSPDVPLERIEEMIRAKWSDWSWPGDFKIGSQGPSWWVEGSTSPKSALVKADGMFTWAAHALKSFYSWEDLLGKGSLSKDLHKRIETATSDYYFDGKHFFTPAKEGGFTDYGEPAMRRRLGAAGLSPDRSRKKGSATATLSEIEQGLYHIETEKRVRAAGPILYRPTGIIIINGGRHLNTSTIRPLLPVDGKQDWGSSGNFPFISRWYDRIYWPKEPQLAHYLTWIHFWYKGAIDEEPAQGQAIFKVGGTGIGKTLDSYGVLGELMGGVADASKFLKEKTSFGGELFKVPLWAVDDETMSVSMQGIRVFTGNIKKSVANTMFASEEKFKMPVQTLFDAGRIVVTSNLDLHSKLILPATDQHIKEKLNFYRMIENKETSPPEQRLEDDFFPSKAEITRILKRELPYFARYIYDFKVPKEFLGPSRYQLKSYQEESLLDAAHHNSGSAAIVELVWSFLDLYTKTTEREPKDTWSGTASELLAQISAHIHLQPLIKNLTARQLSMHLSATENSPALEITSTTNESHLQVWTIRKRK